MAHPSDLAPALVALKAKAIIARSDGEKEVSLQDFFLGPNDLLETVLKSDEFITEIQIPVQSGKTHQAFLKQRVRHSADFALSSVATVARMSEGICEDIRIVLGGVAPFPYVASMAEGIIKGRSLNERLISEASEASIEGARPLPMNHYKVNLTKALVGRALTSIWHGSAK
jgi:xanthine dehydrogenase YagS FAD-binding subunit